jgi:negative regulator of sigma E activity
VWPTRLFLCVLVVVLWPRVRCVLRAVVRVGKVRCVLFAVVFYVVHVFSLPHGADPDISDTQEGNRLQSALPKTEVALGFACQDFSSVI